MLAEERTVTGRERVHKEGGRRKDAGERRRGERGAKKRARTRAQGKMETTMGARGRVYWYTAFG